MYIYASYKSLIEWATANDFNLSSPFCAYIRKFNKATNVFYIQIF